jgi:hypothetical protein
LLGPMYVFYPVCAAFIIIYFTVLRRSSERNIRLLKYLFVLGWAVATVSVVVSTFYYYQAALEYIANPPAVWIEDAPPIYYQWFVYTFTLPIMFTSLLVMCGELAARVAKERSNPVSKQEPVLVQGSV